MAYSYERGHAIADLRSAAGRDRPAWNWKTEDTWQYVPFARWTAIVTCGQTGFSWEFRSRQDSSLIPGGSQSGDIAAMWRTVKAGPPDDSAVPGRDEAGTVTR